MAGKRRYDDGCAIAYGLDLVGERWTLLIARELVFGPKRFTDLQAGLPGVSTDVLAQRLRDLVAAGVLRRHQLPRPASSWVYELTEWGAELEPVLVQLARWGSRSPRPRAELPIGTDALMLSLRVLFNRREAEGVTVSVAIRVGEDEFVVAVADQEISVERGWRSDVDLVLETDVPTLRAMIHGPEPVERLLAENSRVDGDLALLERWRRVFARPEPAAPTPDRAGGF